MFPEAMQFALKNLNLLFCLLDKRVCGDKQKIFKANLMDTFKTTRGTNMVKVDRYELKEGLYYWPKGLTWAKVEPDERVRVGFTDLAQNLAGKIRFIRIRPKGTTVDQGKGFATLETAKWVGPVESPVTGIIDEVNMAIRRKPGILNEDPYGEGWLAIIKPTKPKELEKLIHGEAIFDWYKGEIKTRVKK